MPSDQDSAPSSDALAANALRQMLADLADRLHDAIDAGLDASTLHNIVGLWEANNLNEELTFDALVDAGMPTPCDDCRNDVTPYDDDGRPLENGWEWYMVRDDVWAAAIIDGEPPRFLCVGCLERRIGRRLAPEDFADLDLNQPSWMCTRRLAARLGG